MYRRMRHSFLSIALLGLVWTSSALAADPDLVGWWAFDEAPGGVARDSSGNGNDGTLQGGATIVDDAERGKVLRVNGVDGYASIPDNASFDITDVTLMFWMKLSADFNADSASSMAPVGKAPDEDHTMQFTLIGKDNSQNPKGAMYLKVEGPAYCYVYTPNKSWTGNTWYHVSAVYNHNTSSASLYIDGQSIGTSLLQSGSEFLFGELDVPLEVGRLFIDKAGSVVKYFDGCIDDVRLYSRALTAQDIQEAMRGVQPVMARRPNPSDKAVDVLRDVALTWTPGEEALQHDVFLGTDVDSVRNATVTSKAYIGRLSEARVAPGRLILGQTYCWRVDEIKEGHPDSPWVGEVWSFTVEPVAIPLPGRFVTAVASSQDSPGKEPGKTVDGSGLIGEVHSQEPNDMWLSGEEPNGASIQYTFDKPYKMHAVQVWNHNTELEKLVGFGIRKAAISYSMDGQVWTELGTRELARAGRTSVDLQDVTATVIRITAQSNWGGLFKQYGLSEVRFEYIPTYARELTPVQDSVAPPDTVLSWRAGREASAHKLYLGTNPNELTQIDMVTSTSYDGASLGLQLKQTYYWRVDEVNETTVPGAWSGDIVRFSTPEYLVIDDFESYNDDYKNYNRVFQVWIDGAGYALPEPGRSGNDSGALVGTAEPPWVERTIVHSGAKAMPLAYDNVAAPFYSQADRTFAVGQDWTLGGARTLVLFFYGDPANTGGQLYVKINGVKIPYGGDPKNINRPWWTQWNIDLASTGVAKLENVTSLSIGVEGNGSSGTVCVDDIRLYSAVPASATVVAWLEAESATSITEPMKAWSDMVDASGGQYIAAAKGNVSKDNPPATGVAKYTITVPGGIYRVVGRVIAPAGSSDSFWARIPGAIIAQQTDVSGWLHWGMERGSAWHWTAINSYDADSATVLFKMPAGTYTLEVAYREEGALLDALVVLQEPPAPEADVVLYEETFPNGQGNYKPMSWIGWQGYVGSNATEVTAVEPGDYKDNNIIVDAEDNKAFHLKGNIAFMFTEEPGVLSQFDVGAFSVEVQKKDTPFRFAIRIDKNNTPGDTSDDAWFATDAGYVKATQTVVTIAFTTTASDWRDMTLKPGVELSVAAAARTKSLPAGDITAFGIYGEANGQLRVFNYKVLSQVP